MTQITRSSSPATYGTPTAPRPRNLLTATCTPVLSPAYPPPPVGRAALTSRVNDIVEGLLNHSMYRNMAPEELHATRMHMLGVVY